MKPLITFDMDQTLISSNICHILAYKHMLKVLKIKKKNVNWVRDILTQKTRYEAVEKLVPEFNEKQVEKGVQLYMNYLNKISYKLAKRKKYSLKILKALKPRYKIAIITNCTELNAEILLGKGARIPLKYFDLILGSDDVKHVKPNPDEILKAERILKTKAIAHVGDSINDIKAARSARVPVISIATGNHSKSELKRYKPDFLLKDLKNVPEIIKKLNN